jgi:precorrin-6Y C5,15-methyltransferase (decarboxylating)
VAVLTDLSTTPGAIARAMLAAGADDGAAHVLEHLGGPHERRFSGRLSEVAASDFGDPNLLVVEQPPLPRRSRLGLPDDAYAHRGGQLTKRDVRVAALARLAPRAGGVVWDVGAGCGSVAIEAAGLVGDGWVYAVERDPEQLTYLRVNRQRHRAANVEVVAGEAPAALAALPDPDAVFVGGGGGQLAAILEHAATRLRPAGRLVVNAATLDTVERVRRCARDAGWPLEVVQVAVGVGVPVGTGLRLAAQNPVFILTLTPGTASPHPLALASPATTPEEDQ